MGMENNTTTKNRVTLGSGLNGTDYFFTNLGGAYRVYRKDAPFAEDRVGFFRTWDEMWAWVSAN